MDDKQTIYVSFTDTDWVIGTRFADALRQHGYTVVKRPKPGIAVAFSDRFNNGRREHMTVEDCTAMVVILTPAWASQLPAEPNFTLFQEYAEHDPILETVIVSTTTFPVPSWLQKFAQVNAAKVGFDPAVSETIQCLESPYKLFSVVEPSPVFALQPEVVSIPVVELAVAAHAPEKVFVSYGREDKERMQQITRDLRAEGIGVWVDGDALEPGTTDWQREIRLGIISSRGVIYLASPDAASSPFVSHELAIARDNHIRVYAIWVRGSEWSSCAPFGWYNTQYVDGRGNSNASAIQAIITILKKANSGS